jgi:type IV pilus assembly protein PilW
MKVTEMKSVPDRQLGLSLIELMIAMVLGVLITFAATNLFLQSKISYLEDEEYGRLQENGRYALRLISRELSMAGFLGGVFRSSNITTAIAGSDNCTDYLLNAGVPFEHHNDVTDNGFGAPNALLIASACLTPGEHQVDTDMLVLRRTVDTAHVVDGTLETGLSIEPTGIYLRKQEYNVSLTLVQGSQANYSGQLVDIWQYEPEVLFIRNWSRQPGDEVPVLCRKRIRMLSTDTEECLAEGIENMQFEYGIDTDGDFRADRFDPAPSSIDMEGAVAVRIYLLVRSVGPVTGYTNDRTYTLGSTSIPAENDGFYRRVFQTTVLLRNSEVYKY